MDQSSTPVVEVSSLDRHYPELEKEIEEALRRALIYLEETDKYLEVSLLSKNSMKEINKEFRDVNSATGVLSFEEPEELPQDSSEPERIGEIYISPEVIESEDRDPIYLAVHGLLHLLGFSHSGEDDTMEMERHEQEILSYLSEDN